MTALARWTARLLAVAGGLAAAIETAPAQNVAPVVLAAPRFGVGPAGVVVQPHFNTGPRRAAYSAPVTTYAAPGIPVAPAQYRRPVGYAAAPVAVFNPGGANPVAVNPVPAFNPGFANPMLVNVGFPNALAANPNAAPRPFFNPGFVNPPADAARTSPGRNPGGHYDPATGIVLGGAPDFLPWMW